MPLCVSSSPSLLYRLETLSPGPATTSHPVSQARRGNNLEPGAWTPPETPQYPVQSSVVSVQKTGFLLRDEITSLGPRPGPGNTRTTSRHDTALLSTTDNIPLPPRHHN